MRCQEEEVGEQAGLGGVGREEVEVIPIPSAASTPGCPKDGGSSAPIPQECPTTERLMGGIPDRSAHKMG